MEIKITKKYIKCSNLDVVREKYLIYIPKRPSFWSNALSSKCPLNLDFPRTIEVKCVQQEISVNSGQDGYSIIDTEGYGWWSPSIIKAGGYKIN